MGDISKYFNRSEFACQCGCGFDDISGQLVNVLDMARDVLDHPLTVTSGCRCKRWNRKKGGKKTSAHKKGLAGDLKTISSRERFEVLQVLFSLGVTRIGIAKTFIHIDIDDSKPQDVVWLY